MTKRNLPPVVIGPTLMAELGEERGRYLVSIMRAGIRVVMDPFGIDDTPLDVQRTRWKAAREAVDAANEGVNPAAEPGDRA